jgi:hypothetical protein
VPKNHCEKSLKASRHIKKSKRTTAPKAKKQKKKKNKKLRFFQDLSRSKD